MERLLAKIKDLDRKKLVVTGLILILLIYKLVFVGGFGLFDRGQVIEDNTYERNTDNKIDANDRFLSNSSNNNIRANSDEAVVSRGDEDKESNKKNSKIVVYITGAVSSPGVIKIGSDKRLDDAIKMVGGLDKNADINRINMAMKLEDSQHYIIPYKGQDIEEKTDTSLVQAQVSSNSNSQGKENVNGKININSADEKTLESIPGVGPSTAKKIVDYRNKEGKFNSIEDIKNVSGIGNKKFDSMKDFISVK